MEQSRKAALAVTLALVLAALPSLVLGAQDFSGRLTARFGAFPGSADLEAPSLLGWGRIQAIVGPPEAPRGRLTVEAKVEGVGGTLLPSGSLGEAFVTAYLGPLDLSLGSQVVAWSISDAFYPSDVANPWDSSSPVDRTKVPLPLGRLVLNGNHWSVDLVGVPAWEAGRLPSGRWTTTDQAALGALTHDTALDEVHGLSWDSVGYGGHLKASLPVLGGIDLGGTYFHGPSYEPTDAVLAYAGPYPVSYHYEYAPRTVLGADLTVATGGSLLFRAEGAYTLLGGGSFLAPSAGTASAEGVAGLEIGVGPARLLAEYVLDWANPAAGDTWTHRGVAILTWNPGTRLSLKVAASYAVAGGGSGLVATQAAYTLADGLSLGADLYIFVGPADTDYGQYADDNLARVSLTYSF